MKRAFISLYLITSILALSACGKPESFYYKGWCVIDLDGNSTCYNPDGTPQ
jgi:hypothetical protein